METGNGAAEARRGRTGRIYLGTVLLEKNRWSKAPRRPSFRVSDWLSRLAGAGLDGLELWQYHATLCGPEELARLAASPLPIPIFNSYCTMTRAGREERREHGELAARLGCAAVKFNVGGDTSQRSEHLAELAHWRAELPASIRLLCECHPGTIIEQPADARRFFDELGAGGWEIIVHPFSRLESLREWLGLFGPLVTHAHMQMRRGEEVVRFDRRPDVAAEAIGVMRSNGFAGSYTLEFTEGIGDSGENIEALFGNALSDLRFLRERLNR